MNTTNKTDVDWYIENKLFMEIHTSERKSFKSCRRRWDWHFRKSLYPPTTLKIFEFGIAYHKGMETYYNPETWTWDSEVKLNLAIKAFVDSCESQRAKALAANIFYDAEVEQDYNERVELGRGMLKYYASKIALKTDNWKPVKAEIEFIVPIKNPETGEDVIWCKCDLCEEKWGKWITANPPHHTDALGNPFNEDGTLRTFHGLPVVYAGRIDLIVQDRFGNLWLLDWKTAKNITKEEDTSFLDLDEQIASYNSFTRKLGLQIQGFIYHEQRKGFPQRPHENKSRRLGCKFSVAKTQEVDFDTYLKVVSMEDTDSWADGNYDDFLDYLKNEGIVYHSRREVIKSKEQDKQTEYNIGQEALDMIDPKIRIYPNPTRFGCRNCAFIVPCVEKNAGGDYEYGLKTLFEKRDHYYVRQTEGPSTESVRND